MEVTAGAEGSDRFSATAHFGASAAYLLNEADIAPCGRDSAALRPFLPAGTEQALSLPKLGVHLISRALRPGLSRGGQRTISTGGTTDD